MTSVKRDSRPVNLDIATIKLPITAWASISHRLSGVALFFASFLLVWALDLSLSSAGGFAAVADCLQSTAGRAIVWLIAVALSYHALAGVKHLIMDMGIGETMSGGVLGARLVFAATTLAAVYWGMLIW
jgi:succinate dehydrogenase / fumarate reductase cytochrome b subunit